MESTVESSPENDRYLAERDADRKADAWGVLIIFCALIGIALHFVSGWTF